MARAEELSNQFWEENGMAPLGAGLAAFQELNSSLVERQNGNLTDQATDAGLADLIATRSNNPYNFIRHGHLNCVALAYLRTSVRSAATFHLSGN
jgi:hypothetical protein